MKLIETKTLGTAAASIEFTSIPQTFTDLVVVASLRSARAAVGDDIVFRYNGDTGSNYSFRSLAGTGSAVASGSSTLTVGYFGICAAANSTANTFGNGSLYIPNYTGSTAKSSSSDSVGENNATAADQIILAQLYSQTTAISSILIFSNTSSNLVAGSTISLYGILKGSDGIVTTS
jgi:hypothetical protein